MEITNSDWLLGGEMDMECDLIHSEHKPRSRGFIQAGVSKNLLFKFMKTLEYGQGGVSKIHFLNYTIPLHPGRGL